MVPLRRILGVLVVVLGIVILGIGYTSLFSQSVTAYPLNSGRVATITPTIWGSGSLSVSWNGGGAGTVVTLYNCGSACPITPSALTALPKAGSGTGGSGSFSATVSGGTTYGMVENGTANNLVTTTQQVGFTSLGLIGIIIAIVGVVLIVLPSRRRAAAGEEEVYSDETTSEENLGAPMPVTEEPEPTPVPSTPARTPAAAPAAPAPTPYQAPSANVSSDVSAAQANARGRPNLTCAHCGALNEPWLTNCRRCKRPLSKTG
ncbi:MAG: hypothetical protein L3K08_08060 [Thermoplasmata archaeon]|nr:hypothetical protein [Thermoplasmata archaeon]